MREILFRGKHIHALPQNEHLDGTWVYGYLCDENYINTVDEDVYGGKFTSEMLIYPETVCQYTGLTDKNGRKIFEYDIVSAPFTGYAGNKEERKGIVEFVNGAFSVNWNDSEEYGKNFVGYVNDIEVIGNIFDNPELIGENDG